MYHMLVHAMTDNFKLECHNRYSYAYAEYINPVPSVTQRPQDLENNSSSNNLCGEWKSVCHGAGCNEAA